MLNWSVSEMKAIGSATARLKTERMIYIVLNAPAILAATAAAMAFGAVFYRVVGGAAPLAIGTIVTAFVAQFWLAAILAGALILAPPKGGVWTMTLGSAFVIWIGFVAPVLLATYRLRGMRWAMALADAAYWLGAMLIMAIVLRLIGLVPPPV